MKIRRLRSQTGGVAGDQRFVWESLVPRLIAPSKLGIIRTLLRAGQPLTPRELAEATEIEVKHAEYLCRSMERAGVLEVIHPDTAPSKGDGNEASYFFPRPPGASSSRFSKEGDLGG